MLTSINQSALMEALSIQLTLISLAGLLPRHLELILFYYLDTFTLTKEDGSEVVIDSSDIAWNVDIDYNYK